MKVGDMVRHTPPGLVGTRVGLVVDMTQKKVARLTEDNKVLNWDKIEPELHAIVLYSSESQLTIPVGELEVINDKR